MLTKHSVSALFKKFVLLIGIASTLLLTGCQINTDTDLYNQIKSQTNVFAANTQQQKQDSIVYITEKAYDFCTSLKSIAPVVIVVSFIIGILILHIVQEDQAIRKRALFIFIISIPCGMFVITYGLSWLVGTFL